MFDKVLLPIDINHPDSWEKALPAARHCVTDGGEIHILGVVQDLGAAVVASFLPDDFERQAMERVKARLNDFIATEFDDTSRVDTHVAHGHVPEAILRVATQIEADLIVMASHPPDDLQTLLVGSNADKVVRQSTVPVLTIR